MSSDSTERRASPHSYIEPSKEAGKQYLPDAFTVYVNLTFGLTIQRNLAFVWRGISLHSWVALLSARSARMEGYAHPSLHAEND
jgi:hypothetical protein